MEVVHHGDFGLVKNRAEIVRGQQKSESELSTVNGPRSTEVAEYGFTNQTVDR